jgi:DNA repair protein RadA/Sms
LETTAELIKFAKETNIPVILIGHITKDGTHGQNIGTYG